MIIGLVGYAQSGKDTVAKILVEKYGFERRAFADKIREVAYDLNPVVAAAGKKFITLAEEVDSSSWDEAKTSNPEVRRILQALGVAGRNHIHDKLWINAALSNMQLDKNYVITDVRFKNEVYALRDMSAEIWRVERPGVGPVNEHVSEMELAELSADRTLLNGGTIEELELLVKLRLESARAHQIN